MNENNTLNCNADTQQNRIRFSSLLDKMPESVRDSFSDQQLVALHNSLSETTWKKHPLDFRSSLSFFSYQYYYVFIAGRDQRQMTRREIRFKRLVLLAFVILFITFSTLLGLLVLYLIKSAIGIDVFSNFSFGIWAWFQAAFLKT